MDAARFDEEFRRKTIGQGIQVVNPYAVFLHHPDGRHCTRRHRPLCDQPLRARWWYEPNRLALVFFWRPANRSKFFVLIKVSRFRFLVLVPWIVGGNKDPTNPS